jgi:hypothetical protein
MMARTFLRAAIFCVDVERTPEGCPRFSVAEQIVLDEESETEALVVEVFVMIEGLTEATRLRAYFEAMDSPLGQGPGLGSPVAEQIAPQQREAWAGFIRPAAPARAGAYRLVIALDVQVIGWAPLFLSPPRSDA